MRYIIEGDNNYQLGLVSDVLTRRGVKDVEAYMNLTDDVVEPLEHYENLEEGSEMLMRHISEDNNIHILLDTDVDGLTSGAHMFLYIERICESTEYNPTITYHINEGKKHGIDKNDKKFKLEKMDLLIVPDAGSSDKKEVEWLTENDVDVLVIDHHNLEEENILSTEAILINPQSSPRVMNKNIAGVGVVHKFCKFLDEKLGVDWADDYLDLVAVGNVADLIDLREPETKYFVNQGLENVKNGFLKEIADANAYMMNGHMTPTTVGWNIAPSLNATIRVGKPKERLDMFEALIGVDRESHYKTKKFDEMQSLQKTMARVCGNVKGRQDRAVKKSLTEIQGKIKQEGLDKNKILIVNVTGILNTTYTGLVANKLASQYKRPVLLLQEQKSNPKVFGGSGRGYDRHPITDLQVYLQKTGLFNWVRGHDNAFGYEIEKTKVQQFIDVTNKDLADVVVEKLFIVDYEIPMHELTSGMIKEVANARATWGKQVEEPLFAITDIRVNSKDISLHGTRGKTVRFKKNDVSFNLRFANEEKFDKMRMKSREGIFKSKDLNFTIIGKLDVQESGGRQYLQVDIIDYEVKEEDMVVF